MAERTGNNRQSLDDIPPERLSSEELREQFNIYSEIKFASSVVILGGISLIAGSKAGEKFLDSRLEGAISAETGLVGVTLFLAGTLGVIMADSHIQRMRPSLRNKGAIIRGIFRQRAEI